MGGPPDKLLINFKNEGVILPSQAGSLLRDITSHLLISINPRFLPPANEVASQHASWVGHMTRGIYPDPLVARPVGRICIQEGLPEPLNADPPQCGSPSEADLLWRHTPLDTDPPDTDPLEADPPWDATGYGQQAGGTHPTGMHSCCHLSLTSKTSDK